MMRAAAALILALALTACTKDACTATLTARDNAAGICEAHGQKPVVTTCDPAGCKIICYQESPTRFFSYEVQP